jgi:hypothetical protein
MILRIISTRNCSLAGSNLGGGVKPKLADPKFKVPDVSI